MVRLKIVDDFYAEIQPNKIYRDFESTDTIQLENIGDTAIAVPETKIGEFEYLCGRLEIFTKATSVPAHSVVSTPLILKGVYKFYGCNPILITFEGTSQQLRVNCDGTEVIPDPENPAPPSPDEGQPPVDATPMLLNPMEVNGLNRVDVNLSSHASQIQNNFFSPVGNTLASVKFGGDISKLQLNGIGYGGTYVSMADITAGNLKHIAPDTDSLTQSLMNITAKDDKGNVSNTVGFNVSHAAYSMLQWNPVTVFVDDAAPKQFAIGYTGASGQSVAAETIAYSYSDQTTAIQISIAESKTLTGSGSLLFNVSVLSNTDVQHIADFTLYGAVSVNVNSRFATL